jgi:hypothetical protein
MKVLAEGRDHCCNHGSKGISVHSEEQGIGNEDSMFDLIIMPLTYVSNFSTLRVCFVAMTKILNFFDSRDVLIILL